MKAKFVRTLIVFDPDTKGQVAMYIFKDETSGGMFGIDSSYVDQCFEDDKPIKVPRVFGKGKVELTGID